MAGWLDARPQRLLQRAADIQRHKTEGWSARAGVHLAGIADAEFEHHAITAAAMAGIVLKQPDFGARQGVLGLLAISANNRSLRRRRASRREAVSAAAQTIAHEVA